MDQQPFRTLSGEFFEAQSFQVGRWLVNYQLYTTVALLLLLSLCIPVYRWSNRAMISLFHDYFYGVFHTLITFPLLAVYGLLLQRAVTVYAPWIQLNLFQSLAWQVQILVAIICKDFLNFLSHYCRHKSRVLWHFHTVHHSQRYLNPFTTKRTHIVEEIFENGVIKWIPLAIMGSPPQVWIGFILVDAAWDYFIHSNLRISFGPLNYVFVSPLYHRLHHSSLPKHFDKNFADRFVIWDLLFGTASFDFADHPTGVTAAPIDEETSLMPQSLFSVFLRQWIYPFKMNYIELKRRRARSQKEP